MMNRTTFISLMKFFSGLQPFRSPNFSDEMVLEFWYSELKKNTIEALKEVLVKHARENDHFPSLREVLIALSENKQSTEESAKACAIGIYQAICRYGYMQWDDARKDIGKLGEDVVERYGGWVNLCNFITNENQSFVIHNLGELARSILTSPPKKAPITLPSGKSPITIAIEAPRDIKAISEGKAKTKIKRIANPKGDNGLATS